MDTRKPPIKTLEELIDYMTFIGCLIIPLCVGGPETRTGRGLWLLASVLKELGIPFQFYIDPNDPKIYAEWAKNNEEFLKKYKDNITMIGDLQKTHAWKDLKKRCFDEPSPELKNIIFPAVKADVANWCRRHQNSIDPKQYIAWAKKNKEFLGNNEDHICLLGDMVKKQPELIELLDAEDMAAIASLSRTDQKSAKQQVDECKDDVVPVLTTPEEVEKHFIETATYFLYFYILKNPGKNIMLYPNDLSKTMRACRDNVEKLELGENNLQHIKYDDDTLRALSDKLRERKNTKRPDRKPSPQKQNKSKTAANTESLPPDPMLAALIQVLLVTPPEALGIVMASYDMTRSRATMTDSTSMTNSTAQIFQNLAVDGRELLPEPTSDANVVNVVSYPQTNSGKSPKQNRSSYLSPSSPLSPPSPSVRPAQANRTVTVSLSRSA